MGLGKLLRTVQGDELQRLLALLLQHSIISAFLCLICQLNSPSNTADAAGCSPKPASAAGNVPRNTVYRRAQGAEAASGRAGAARRSNLCVIICSCARGAGDRNRARRALRLAMRLLLHSSSVPQVNKPGGATAQGDESHRLPLLSVKNDSKKRDRHDLFIQ